MTAVSDGGRGEPRIGVVLGAGGVVGHAFHAGTLAALAEATGWDARTATVIVGTSAGSVVGALLRTGISPADIAARATGAPVSPEGQERLLRLGPPRPYPGDGAREPLGPPAFPSRALLARAALRPWQTRPGSLAAAVMPRGTVPTEPIVAGIRALYGRIAWPERALLICAVRLSDGQRVVFGRPGTPQVRVADAVAASCAIPAYFRPVSIAGFEYVDGGAHSPTNADVLAGERLDLVVISSPMSTPWRGMLGGIDFPLRGVSRALLDGERLRLRRAGIPVVLFEPTAADRAVMGLDAMNPARRGAVTEQSRRSALERLADPAVRRRLSMLTGAVR
ncbi:MAG: patatin-like phospholipase family protein [Chloroflexi bacterium]|nr:MAG: patatin-like phospholipase family protein [Chloroflexota bacterium]